MEFFKNFRHDGQQNVIKRTPLLRAVRILKNAWHTEENYHEIFGNAKSSLMQSSGGGISAADLEYSSLLRPFQLAYQTITNHNQKQVGQKPTTFKDDLPLKRINPRVVASAKATAPKVTKKTLINIINHLNFIKEQVFIHVKDYSTGEEFLQQGEPGPCLNDKVAVRFVDSATFDLKRHIPLNLIVDNRKSLVVIPIDLISLDQELLVLRIPDKAHSYSKRQAVRHICEGVDAEIVQGNINVHGVLEDINPNDLRIYLNAPEDINPANHLFLKLNQDDKTHFMGECRMLRSDNEGSYIILQPVHDNRPIFSTRKYPNDRVRITPHPVIHFVHPLCGLSIQYKVDDISASGFSVTVPENESLLIPGMIIPQMTLQLPGMVSSLTCAAQVIYRFKQTKNLARYGFYILDMSLHDQRRLFDAVSKAADPHVNMTGKVNMNSLWELFFGSGFIYPDKYGIISPYATALKETYRKLYEEGQDIFTHLTYQDQGQVYAHMSMVKTYEESWIIHHMAAVPMKGIRTGLKILNHFVNYMDCLYRLPVHSKDMRYNFCYYRPENKFSNYYFGGVWHTFKNRDVCSRDLFAYMSMHVDLGVNGLSGDWTMEKFSRDDLSLMREYYKGIGGGMMLDAFALEFRAAENERSDKNYDSSANHNHNNIMSMYHKIGLKRECQVFSIRQNGRIKAAVIVDVSDLGVNMSELINSIKVIVIDNTLPWSVLKDAVSIAGRVYGLETIMILIYPFDYLGQQGVDCKKRYYFWVLNTNMAGSGMDVIKNHVKVVKRKFITEKFTKELAKKRRERLLEKLEQK